MNFPGSLLLSKRKLFFEKEKKGNREICPEPKGKWKCWAGNEKDVRNLDYSGP